MAVPPVGSDLDEPHARLREAPRQQALPTKIIGRLGSDSVKFPRRLGLASQVQQRGHLRLHPEREFERFDSTLQPLVSVVPLQMRAVHLLNQVQLTPLALGPDRGIVQIADRRPSGTRRGVPEGSPLVDGWQEGIPVELDAAAIAGDVRRNGDEGWQVAVFGAQPVRHPRTDGRPHKLRRPGVQLAHRRRMRLAVGFHRLQQADVVDVLAEVRQQV